MLIEICLTLLPYFFALTLVLLVIFWRQPALALIFLILGGVIGFKIYSFSFIHRAAAQSISNQTLKLAEFNKLYSNTNYPQIDMKLTEVNPDIIGFTEFKDKDLEGISYLKNYPYHLLKPSRDKANLAIFSRYPISLNSGFSSQFVLPVKVNLPDQELEVYLVHPYPMMSNNWIDKRDQELQTLASHLTSGSTNSILLGDFNLSPWSPSYSRLVSLMPGLKNAAQGTGLHFTTAGFFRSQIDHIFVPTSATVEQFKVENVTGSDHHLIWTSIKI